MILQTNTLVQYTALPQEIINFIPANISWKTREGEFLGCNQPVVELFNLDSTQDLVGRSLEKVIEKKYALPLLEHDHYVMSNQKEMVFEESFIDSNGKQYFYLSRKAPLFSDQNEVIGLVSVAINVTDRMGLENAINTAAVNIEKHTEQTAGIQAASQTLLQTLTKQVGLDRYYLPVPFENCYLTQRELDCVFHLLEGKSAKEIGRALNLSFRTIEFYISKIKTKLNCRTRLDLANKMNSLITQQTAY
jgi:DNA-binding CsgD family transcriptional regulator